jgi:hypothetical protein
VFAPCKYFQPSLCLVQYEDKKLALSENIRLGKKYLQGTNALAYFASGPMRKKVL